MSDRIDLADLHQKVHALIEAETGDRLSAQLNATLLELLYLHLWLVQSRASSATVLAALRVQRLELSELLLKLPETP